MKMFSITLDEKSGEVVFAGNMQPEEAILVIFQTAKQGLFNPKEDVKEVPEQV